MTTTEVVPKPRVVDTGLLADIKRYGAADVSACFSCGNCTAICPMVTNDGTFPRRLIRYGQVGLKDELLSSKELWLCYHCGQCTVSCPQQADPGEYMAAARRYAIANYDKTRIARMLYTKPALASVLEVLVAAAFASVFYVAHGTRSTSSLAFFSFIPDSVIHWTGVGVMIAALLVVAFGVATMVRGIARQEGVTPRALWGGRAALASAWRALWDAFAVDALAQRRFREDCVTENEPTRWFERRWVVHGAIMWGFLGLLAATILDYAFALTGVRATGAVEPVWYPVRLLGTLAGVAMVWGVSVMLVKRLRHVKPSLALSTQSDWVFLVMLWVIGVSGLLTELALYLPGVPAWGYWMFLFHVSAAMELLVLLPFMKFAHAIYRPVALFFLSLARSARRAPAT